ncbi:alpha/beta fold hydrolase [Pseudomonas sp. NFPP24]|uniref:alpha/beta fold hydrolase n=1 Tax=Pseudomonas sp. NFPP24 TaxID=1566228 RepID=UPI0008F16C4E|nr:alpha/beta fold hydrolase [Pseudomonas sp. NFPP24]SFA70728.1 Pimeloyl-ACP methyl ester carboxylesterase [Pseudomonas sp. NFPP24]
MSVDSSLLTQLEGFTRQQLMAVVARLHDDYAVDADFTPRSHHQGVSAYDVCWRSAELQDYLQAAPRVAPRTVLAWTADPYLLERLRCGTMHERSTSGPSTATLSARLAELARQDPLTLVVDVATLWATDDSPSHDDFARLATLLSELRDVLNRIESDDLNLLFLTHGAISTGDQSPGWLPLPAIFHGLGKALNLELDLATVTTVDQGADRQQSLAHLLAVASGSERQVKLVEDRVYFPALALRPAPDVEAKSRPWGNCLVVGGMGALGRELVHFLRSQGAGKIVAVGRTAHSRIAVRQALGEEVIYSVVDITRPLALADLKATLAAQDISIDSVFHLAGSLHEGLFVDSDTQQDIEVLQGKLMGAINLLEFFDAPDIRHCFFSSIASVIGTRGAGMYSAANEFLDQLARGRQAEVFCINWGPMLNVGMATRHGQDAAGIWASLGVQPLVPEQALQALRGLNGGPRQQLIAEVDWVTIQRLVGHKLGSRLLADLVAQAPAQSAGPQSRLLKHLAGLKDREAAISCLEQYLSELFQRFSDSRDAPLTLDSNISEWNLDSLVLMELLSQVKRDLDFIIYPREIFTHNSIRLFSRYLYEQLFSTDAPGATVDDDESLAGAQAFPAELPVIDADIKVREGVVFLLSSPRSGSTLLRAMVQGHPQIFAPPELHLLAYATIGEWKAASESNYFDQGLQRALMEIFLEDAQAASERIDHWVRENTPVSEVYQFLLDHTRCPLLVDKSPSYASSAQALVNAESQFERPRYIHLVRHPLPVIESFTRMRMHKLIGAEAEDGFSTAQKIWQSGNQNVLDFFQAHVDPQRVIHICYEDLVREPEPVIRRLCDFLGVDYDAAMLNPYAQDRMSDGVHATSMAIEDPNFKTREAIDPRLADAWKNQASPRALSAQTQALARRLGYAPMPAALGVQRRESFVTSLAEPMCVSEWGAPSSAPSMLFLHGLLEQGPVWDSLVQHLDLSSRRYVAPDIRGHGRSGHGSSEQLATLLDYVLDMQAIHQQYAMAPLHLVAHSFGSVIAVAYASAFPQAVKSLTLVEPVLPVQRFTPQVERYRELVEFLKTQHVHKPMADLEEAASRLRTVTPSLLPAQALELARRITRPAPEGICWTWDARLRFRAGMGLGISRLEYIELLQGLPLETHLVLGSKSRSNRKADLEVFHAAVAPQRIHTLEGGHNLHVECPEQVVAVLNGILE